MCFSVFDCIDLDPRWSGNPFDKNHKLNGAELPRYWLDIQLGSLSDAHSHPTHPTPYPPRTDNAVVSFPEDLMYILRAIQIMRGMATSLGQQFCVSRLWAPMAQHYLDIEKTKERIQELESTKSVDLRRGVVI